MASNSHILLRKLEEGEMIPPEISAVIQLPITGERYKSTHPIDAMVVGFQKFTQPNKDTFDLLSAASPIISRVMIDSTFRQLKRQDVSKVTDPLQQLFQKREQEARQEYHEGQSQRWVRAMSLPMASLRLHINTIQPNEQAYLMLGEKIEDPADFANTMLLNIEKMSRSRTSLCGRIGLVSGGDADVVFVDTVNSNKVLVS